MNLIQVQGYSPTEAGAAILPLILLIFLLSRWAGGLVKQFGPKIPLVVGPAITSLGFALFLRLGITYSYWISFFPAILILGLGMAISVAPLTTVVMNSVTRDHVGAASGVNNAISRIAGLLAIAILGLIMIMVFNHQLNKNLRESTLPITIQQKISEERSQLANIKTNDETAQRIIQESFIAGYKAISLVATTLALASSLIAAVMIDRSQLMSDCS